MKLDKLKIKPVQIPDDAPFDFEDEDNHFKELKINPKKPYTEKQITAAIKVLYKMLHKQSDKYGKGKSSKLYKAGIVEESIDLSQSQLSEFNKKAGELINHLASVHDEHAIKLLTELVSLMYQECDPECQTSVTSDEVGPIAPTVDSEECDEIPLGNKFPTLQKFGLSLYRESIEEMKVPRASAYGGILIKNGKILLREVTNHFGGYVWTYAKGRPDPGDTPQETALREVFEETGYHAKITGLIPGQFGGDTSTTVFFSMEPVGEPEQFGWETAQIKWVSKEEAKELIQLTTSTTGKKRDLQVLEAAFSYHPNM